MTSDDVKHLLQSVADQGTSTVGVDEGALAARIQRRRYRRTATVGIAGVAGAAVIAASASAVLPGLGSERPVAGPSTPDQAIATTFPARPYQCGDLVPAPSTKPDDVVMTLKTKSRTTTGLTGTVVYTVPEDIRGGYTLVNALNNPEFALVLDRKVVATATLTAAENPTGPLGSGKVKIFPARIDIRSCDPATELPAGSYLMYEDESPGKKPVTDPRKEVLPTEVLQVK